jgi:quinol monooxygenase YgiN
MHGGLFKSLPKAGFTHKEMTMIHVIASINVKTGKLSDYLAVLTSTMPLVRKEQGCIEYVPVIDVDAKLPVQVFDKNAVTILERWQSLETLHAHLGSPHMLEYREKVKDLVERVSVKVLRAVD